MSNPLRDNLGMKMKKRHQISRKAGILGTCRRLLLLAVRRVREEEDCRYSQEELPWDSPLDKAYSVPALSVQSAIPWNGAQLPSEDGLRVRSAEFWLKLGEVDEALRELVNGTIGKSHQLVVSFCARSLCWFHIRSFLLFGGALQVQCKQPLQNLLICQLN